MKVAVLSEAEHDEILVRGLVDGLLGVATEPVSVPIRRRASGWPHVKQLLPKVLQSLDAWTDADALVVVVDSDETPAAEADCVKLGVGHRPTEVRALIHETLGYRQRPQGRAPLKFAVGLAVPTIEAWALHGRHAFAIEAAAPATWRGGTGRVSLKRLCYDSEPALQTTRARVMTDAARRLCADLPAFERAFPVGFGMLAADVRRW